MSSSTSAPIRRDILKGWRVMVVDDEPDSLDVAQRVLRHYGAEVFTAVNGKDALSRVRQIHPDFIISDLSMPELDGWGLLYELKLDRATMDIPIIALTAHAMAGDRNRGIAAGFHNYMTKPLTPATFMSELLILLQNIPQFEPDFVIEAKERG